MRKAYQTPMMNCIVFYTKEMIATLPEDFQRDAEGSVFGGISGSMGGTNIPGILPD